MFTGITLALSGNFWLLGGRSHINAMSDEAAEDTNDSTSQNIKSLLTFVYVEMLIKWTMLAAFVGIVMYKLTGFMMKTKTIHS